METFILADRRVQMPSSTKEEEVTRLLQTHDCATC